MTSLPSVLPMVVAEPVPPCVCGHGYADHRAEGGSCNADGDGCPCMRYHAGTPSTDLRHHRNLTGRQVVCLHFIADSIMTRGAPPTLREIGIHMGIRSTNGVNDHLRALSRKGMLIQRDMKARGLVLTAAGWAALGMETPAPPVVERVVVTDPMVVKVRETVERPRMLLMAARGELRELISIGLHPYERRQSVGSLIREMSKEIDR